MWYWHRVNRLMKQNLVIFSSGAETIEKSGFPFTKTWDLNINDKTMKFSIGWKRTK